ncbi:MAG TPA: prolyl oligopeptidase family serine peptidase, partial [Thermoanaerobaculia bacterium]|nr:prolyl oligopeptidase family serine peptidase [Thermoanaerobaculia bacterium]
PETRAWIDAENKVTNAFLESVPSREAIKKRLMKLQNYERYSAPFHEGGRYFYQKNDGLQNQAVLYVMEKLGGEPRVLIDPNGLSKDGTVALATLEVSRDGKWLAYALAAAGSDWHEWHVRNVETGQDTSDLLKWTKFTDAAWTVDGKGFYYGRFAAPKAGNELEAVNKDQKLYYHRLGTPQSEDSLVYERPDDPELQFQPAVTDDGRYLVLSVFKGTDRRNRLYYKDLSRPESGMIRLFDDFDAAYHFVGNVGSTFFIRTDLSAPKGRVVAVDLAKIAAKPELLSIIPESKATLQTANVVARRLVVSYLEDAAEHVRLFSLGGNLEKEITLPTLGSVTGLGGRADDTETFYSFTSFNTPTTVFRYDFSSGKSEVFKKPNVSFDPAAFEVEEVFYPSKDGTKVPMFLVHKRGMKKDGKNPTLLYGYGGFNIPLAPAFSIRVASWVERGGVYAVPTLRGGGEYGEDWHQAGTKLRKQNVFDDFAAAAEWLIASKITSPKRLAINGGSNGGLLVGATLNQHPELFGAAVPQVGVMDMLRFHKFTIGWAWTSDYGSPDKPEEFKWLSAYSPLQNIKKGAAYPPVLITTADHDDRVVPAHSFKYAAALQAAQGGDAPILIRIETKAGHGAGKPTSKIIEEAADIQAFLEKTLGGLAPVPAS